MPDATENLSNITKASPQISQTAAPQQTQAAVVNKPKMLQANAGPVKAAPVNAGQAKPKIDLTPIIHQAQPVIQSEDERIERIIDRRLRAFRSHAWEDDISCNTMDDRPFDNLPSMKSRGKVSYQDNNMMPEALLKGRDIEKLAQRDPHPIPCLRDREGYSPESDEKYWLSGLADHFKLMNVAEEHGTKVRSYFDFGCATGRVLRHFACQSNVPEIWGSDINARHARWLSEFMPRSVKPIANHCIPTLPIADNSIDLISAFSVFTHIDTFEVCWLAELARCLRPDGIAYLTVHNENTWFRLRKDRDNPNIRLLNQLRKMDPETDEKLMKPLADTRTVYRHTTLGPYRALVFHSNNYLRRVWGRFFKILELKPSYHARQTVLVLRKK